jgi:hypothetical protein
VERCAEGAVLTRACALAEHTGVDGLPCHRADLMRAGRAAAQTGWTSELQAAARRLRGEIPERAEEADVARLRRRLEDLARLEEE